MLQNITDLSRKLSHGKITSQSLVETVLQRIDNANANANADAGPAFLAIYHDKARTEAKLVDEARSGGLSLPPYAGIPIAIKDLFDVRGEVTRAGSQVLDLREPARCDAQIVSNLRRSGFIIVGKNNMTEFAYSGLGVNVHFGTPLNPHDKVDNRVPGGSSSGAAVSVAEGMVPTAIGTDTGGSCRIPAAFCSVVGFKPSSDRVSTVGSIPLSQTLDCIGSFATSVSCCAILDSVLSGGSGSCVDAFPKAGVRLGVLEGYVIEHMDGIVAAAYQDTLARLSRSGVRLTPITVKELAELPVINQKGGIVGAEAYAWHQDLLQTRGDYYDPWVRARFEAGKSQSVADYIRLFEHRTRIRQLVFSKLSLFDAFIFPTVQIVPPKLSELSIPEQSNPINLMCIRNTAVGNFLDSPAISIPCHDRESLPVGMMLMGMTGDDRRLLAIAKGLEQVIRGLTV